MIAATFESVGIFASLRGMPMTSGEAPVLGIELSDLDLPVGERRLSGARLERR